MHVVTHSFAAGRGHRVTRSGLPGRRRLLGYAAAIVGPLLLTAALAGLPEDPNLSVTLPLFLLLTVLVALLGGMGPALLGAIASSLFLNWFFTPPIGGLTISEPENVIALGVFLLVAAAVAWVVDRSARRADRAVRAQSEAASLAELSHSLLGSTDQLGLLLRRATEMFGAQQAAVLRRATDGRPAAVIAATDPALTPERLTGELPREQADEEHVLILVSAALPAGRQRLLAAFAAHVGAILQRRSLQASADEAVVLARDSSARTALLSAVSHDLRTPLAGIKAAIGSLRSSEVTFSPQDEAELEAVIEDSADRLDALIGNLLDMSRLQAGALVAHPRPVDLGEIIPGVVAALPDPERVDWRLDPGARVVVADPGLLDRVLGNLVENALRHQVAPARVRVWTSGLGAGTQIRVVDAGPGVPEAERDRIFQPFQRHGDAPAGAGVGLGLAVARGLTEAMGGTVTAEDTPGGGLTMVVELPSARGD